MKLKSVFNKVVDYIKENEIDAQIKDLYDSIVDNTKKAFEDIKAEAKPKKEEVKTRTILECLFYDENEELESISVYVKDKKEAKEYCRNLFMLNAEMLVDDLVSDMETETETINNELEKDNNFNYTGVKRIHAIISQGIVEGIEHNSFEDLVNKLN